MSEWFYVAAAFTAVWGALAVYAFLLARRVSQAEQVVDTLRETLQGEEMGVGDDAVCDLEA